MRTLLGIALLTAAFWSLVLGLLVLSYPPPPEVPYDPFGYYAPWYVRAAWITATGGMAWTGGRLLNRGMLGRLVRGRGLTPADR
jgi:hypothetical protein